MSDNKNFFAKQTDSSRVKATNVNRGQAPFTGCCYRERQPVPGVHLQHFDIVPRLMPVMRESCRTPAPSSFICLHVCFLSPISLRWNSAMLWHWERRSISWRTLSSVCTDLAWMSASSMSMQVQLSARGWLTRAARSSRLMRRRVARVLQMFFSLSGHRYSHHDDHG